MAHLLWKKSYDTGIHEIDIQHQELLNYVNQLDDARSRKSRTEVKNVIEGMADYTISHFAFEEALMEQANYPYVGPHRHVHKTLIDRVNGFTERFENGEDISEEFHALLRRWLINHIQRDDAAYIKPVRAHLKELEKAEMKTAQDDEKRGWIANAVRKFFGG